MEENHVQQNIASQFEQIRTMFKSKSIIKQTTEDDYSHVDRVKSNRSNTKTTYHGIIVLLAQQKDESTTNTVTMLYEIVNKVEIFIDRNECIDYLSDVEEDKNVYLVISQAIDRQFIQLIENIIQIQYIYVLKEKTTNDIFPIRAKGKVKGVFESMESILDRLRLCILRHTAANISYSILPRTMMGPSNRNEVDQSFMYTQLIKEIILEIEFDANSMKQFVDFCLSLYENNHQQCEKVKSFQMEYKTHSPLWWYSKETFVYSLLNKALREQDTKIIVKMAFFIRDLLDEINKKYVEIEQSTKLIVYRGQGMLENEFENIKKNKGGLLSFNNFLSTTTDRDVAQMFAASSRDDSDMIGILLQMEVNSSVPDISYACLKDISNFDDEDEILFSMTTVFRIEELNQIEDHLWIIKLIATNANDSSIQSVTQHIRNEIKTIPGWAPMSNLLLIMGRYEEAMEILNLANETTFNEYSEITEMSLDCMNGFVNEAYLLKEKWSACIIKTKDILEKCQKFYTCNHIFVIKLYCIIAIYYLRCGNHKDGLLHAEKALELSSHLRSDVDMNNGAMTSHLTIGEFHYSMSNFSLALISFEQAQDNAKKLYPENHLHFLSIYYGIGESYRQLGKYSLALKYLEQALTIGYKYTPTDHPFIIETLQSIGASHLSLSSYASGLSNLEKALNICERYSPPRITQLGSCYSTLGAAYSMLRDYSLALSYYEKCLTVLQKAFPENHPDLGLCHLHIGIVQTALGNPSSALTHLEKALHIMKSTLPSDHLYLGYSYISIGELYRSLGKYSVALSHLEKGLEILKKSLPIDHADLATIYRNISLTKALTQDYTHMFSDLEKSAQISQNVISDNAFLFSDSNALIQRSENLTELTTTVSSTHKPVFESANKLFQKKAAGTVTDNDIGELISVLNNSKNGFSNIEQTLKNLIQSRTSDNPTFGNCNDSSSSGAQLLEHALRIMSNGKRTLDSIQDVVTNKQNMITHENIRNSEEQALNNIALDTLSHFEKVVEVERQQRPPNDPFITAYYNKFGETFLMGQSYSIALHCFEKALAAIPFVLPTNHELYARTYSNMAKALDGLQRYQEALDYAQRAVDVVHSSFDCSLDNAKIYEDQLRQLQRKSRR